MLLNNKNAVIYGAGGSLGGAVARAFASEGAHVILTGRTKAPIKKVADEILATGGKANHAIVDALDEKQVNDHLKSCLKEVGSIDISFNAIHWEDVQGIPLAEMKLEDFMRPIHRATQTNFLTATAAARIMQEQGSGVILSLTATPGGTTYPTAGGFGPACCAVESFTKVLASELGPKGVRVINIRSGGSPDSRPFREALEKNRVETEPFIAKIIGDTMLKKMPLMKEVASVAVFLASSMASSITGTTIDVTCGTTHALNIVKGISFIPEPHTTY